MKFWSILISKHSTLFDPNRSMPLFSPTIYQPERAKSWDRWWQAIGEFDAWPSRFQRWAISMWEVEDGRGEGYWVGWWSRLSFGGSWSIAENWWETIHRVTLLQTDGFVKKGKARYSSLFHVFLQQAQTTDPVYSISKLVWKQDRPTIAASWGNGPMWDSFSKYFFHLPAAFLPRAVKCTDEFVPRKVLKSSSSMSYSISLPVSTSFHWDYLFFGSSGKEFRRVVVLIFWAWAHGQQSNTRRDGSWMRDCRSVGGSAWGFYYLLDEGVDVCDD